VNRPDLDPEPTPAAHGRRRCGGGHPSPRERPAARAAGPETGSRFILDTDLVTVGRHPESDIFLDDVTVSRRHAEFHREEDSFTVRDVESLNSTYVNHERIDRVHLADGDEVQIGKYRLVFYTGRETG
jgi:pSer/pThr/pTyr-binding forkhead associated (FHA) protein